MKRKFPKMLTANYILDNCKKLDNGCMIFRFNTPSIRINGNMISVSKIIYEKFYKTLEYKERIDRTCNNGKCLNPDHMLPSSAIDKFWRKVIKGSDDKCWEWIGSKDGGGYGMFGSPNLTETKAHRISWVLNFGEIPNELFVCHTCDNSSCVNPKHLFLGTNQDNMDDKVKKERQSRLVGERNGNCLMTKEKVIEMRNLYSSGKYSYRDLVRKFNVSQTQVARILHGESWSWV